MGPSRLLKLLFFLECYAILTLTKAELVSEEQNKDSFNKIAYARVCQAKNFKLKDVCHVHRDVIQAFGNNLDAQYVEQKVFAKQIVQELAESCETAEVCNNIWEQIAVDRIKLDWRDTTLRHRYCRLRPCLRAILREGKKLDKCKSDERRLGFRAFNLLCQLSENVEPDGDVMGCVDAALELLQYNAADIKRNLSSVENICTCTNGTNTKCPQTCRDIVKKYHCLTQRCSIDTESFLHKFGPWSWYFKNEQSLINYYKIQSCDEETEEVLDEKPSLVVTIIDMHGVRQAFIAVTIGIVVACCTVLLSIILYRKYYRPRAGRNRNEYTEMKDGI